MLSTKVDILLCKATPGKQWTSLETKSGDAAPPTYDSATAGAESAEVGGSNGQAAPAAAPAVAAAGRPRSKWDNLQLADDDDGEDGDGASKSAKDSSKAEGGVDAFFQQLYADADDDTRRAMMKSYTESGGTSLSTNWAEVGKGEVKARPPDGMEARKW